MSIPKLAAVLGGAGLFALVLSAFVGGTSMADRTLDVAQLLLAAGAAIFEIWVAAGILYDALWAAMTD